jgi:pyrroloquinoline-quinone synthase
MRARLAALEEHYPWIDPAGFDYFRHRLQQAPRDAGHALDLVTTYCATRADQERAIEALTFKCDLLWAQLDAIERGETRPPAARP